ncbi:MAG: phosphoglucosamine mutase [Verrucomicrobia bacterium]|nr:phosphoglucosamine mutase [Verrucomicrobiota bacterium]
MKRVYFGTDGVRGPYGGPVINEAFAERLGVAAARFVSRQSHTGAQRVLIGRDTRSSGQSLMQAVSSGFASVGVDSVMLGVVPTPAVASALVRERAALGVMITASHNPASDNGIKFFSRGGVKLSDQQELEIEKLLPAEQPTIIHQRLHQLDGLRAYMDNVNQLLPANALAGWKIVLDTANGATCMTSPVVLRGLGAEVVTIGDAPDGQNINAGVGSEHPEKLAAKVLATGSRIGIAHDGDGDRCILCDEHGVVLDGDEILTILALHALKQGVLPGKTLVVTVQSNLGVDAALRDVGGRVLRTNVGDRYVVERMMLEKATLGGESSGHIVFSDISPTGDGLVAALKVLGVMLETRQPLSQLRKCLKKYPQATANFKVREKKELATLPHLPMVIQALEAEMGGYGRVLVRFSGTEAKIRLLVEGPTEEIVRKGLARIEAVVRTDLEVI